MNRISLPMAFAPGFRPCPWSADFPGTVLLLVVPGSRPELQSVRSADFAGTALPLVALGFCTWLVPVVSVRVIGRFGHT